MKLPKQRTRKLTRSSTTSYFINIPKHYINKLKWRERQKLVVKLTGKKVTIQDWK